MGRTNLEWVLAADRGPGAIKLGPWLDAWPLGISVGLGSRTKAFFPCRWGGVNTRPFRRLCMEWWVEHLPETEMQMDIKVLKSQI